MEGIMVEATKPFRMVSADENSELFRYLLKRPLLLAIYWVCFTRARRVLTLSRDGLKQFEFYLSELEYEKFGLRSSQKGKITRRMQELIRLNLIKKSGSKTVKWKSNVFALLPTEFVNINPEIGNGLENKQIFNEFDSGTNNNVNNGKNENNEKLANISSNNTGIERDLSTYPEIKEYLNRLLETRLNERTKNGEKKVIGNLDRYKEKVETEELANAKEIFALFKKEDEVVGAVDYGKSNSITTQINTYPRELVEIVQKIRYRLSKEQDAN